MIEPRNEPLRLKLIVTITIAIAASTGVSAWLVLAVSCPLSPEQPCDLTNWQSFLLEGIIFAGGLGSFFYYLQTQDNRKTQTVLSLQKQISEEIRNHIEQQRQIQDSIRVHSFNSIKVNLASASAMIERLVHDIENFKTLRTGDQVALAHHLDDQLQRIGSFRLASNNIKQQLTIVRPYVHAEIASKIESIANRIEYTSLSSKDASDGGRVFLVRIPDTVDSWLSYAKENVREIEMLDKAISEYKP